MKSASAIIFCMCVIIITCNAQEKEQVNQCPPGGICDPTMFDEYCNISWRDERARLDNVAMALKAEPSAVVYLSVYGGRRGCVGEVQARAVRAKSYLVNKLGIQAERVLWKDAGYREEHTVEIWIQPRWAVEPYPAPSIDNSEAQVRSCKAPYPKRKQSGRL